MPDAIDFRERYAELPEKELLELAQSYPELTDAAQAALRAEFVHRKLDPPIVHQYPEGDKLVTVRRYRDLSEGIVARSLLESAGIYVELRDENLIRLDWQISNFIGGLRLQVPATQAAQAEELLSQAVVDPIAYDEADDLSYSQPHCPNCGSTEITFEGASRTAALAGLYVIGLPLPPGRKTWTCSQCGTRWGDDQDDADE